MKRLRILLGHREEAMLAGVPEGSADELTTAHRCGEEAGHPFVFPPSLPPSLPWVSFLLWFSPRPLSCSFCSYLSHFPCFQHFVCFRSPSFRSRSVSFYITVFLSCILFLSRSCCPCHLYTGSYLSLSSLESFRVSARTAFVSYQ